MLFAFLGGVAGDADQGGAEEFVAEFVAAADLFEDLVVGVLKGFDAAEGLVDSGVELGAYGFDGLDVESAEGFFHLLDDELYTGAELGYVAV